MTTRVQYQAHSTPHLPGRIILMDSVNEYETSSNKSEAIHFSGKITIMKLLIEIKTI